MRSNVLIAKTELGKVKKTTFNNSTADKTYGMQLSSDTEGAREVTSSWKEHEPNPHAKPGPDYLAMNKAAADGGLVSSSQVKEFRETHPLRLRTGVDKVTKAAPILPSDIDPSFTYGTPASFRSAEDNRNFGPLEPPIKGLVQGQYMNEWTTMNLARKDDFDIRKKYIKPSATAATQGHALGAALTIAKTRGTSSSNLQHAAAAAAEGWWKMKKFERAEPRVTKYMGKGQAASSISAAATQEQEWLDGV
eukprot:gene3479-3749_t